MVSVGSIACLEQWDGVLPCLFSLSSFSASFRHVLRDFFHSLLHPSAFSLFFPFSLLLFVCSCTKTQVHPFDPSATPDLLTSPARQPRMFLLARYLDLLSAQRMDRFDACLVGWRCPAVFAVLYWRSGRTAGLISWTAQAVHATNPVRR